LTGTNDVLNQGATAGAMQHLGEGRLEARSLAGSQDDDGEIRQSHGWFQYSPLFGFFLARNVTGIIAPTGGNVETDCQ
jgi:hypothetical protein